MGRLNFVCAGTLFAKQRNPKKSMFVKLSAHQKYIYYGDWNDKNSVPETEQLTEKMAVADIKDVISTTQPSQGGSRTVYSITITTHQTVLELIANDKDVKNCDVNNQKICDHWQDALNILMDKSM